MSLLKNLKKKFKHYDIDGYLVPKNDIFFSEYSKPDKLKEITGFKGSAGTALILKKSNYLIVDGRYVLQAHKESGKNFKIIDTTNIKLENFFKKFNNLKIGYDPKLFTSNYLKNYLTSCRIKPLRDNLINTITLKKKSKNSKFFYYLKKSICGESVISKINKITNFLKLKGIDNLFISSNENVAWLLNLRGLDNPNAPIPNCKVIINKNKKIYFFSELNKTKKIHKNKYYKNIEFFEQHDFYKVLSFIKGKNFSIDKSSCSIFEENLIKSKFLVKYLNDPCYLHKSKKNKTEIYNTIKTHIYDGVALTKFIFWLKNKKKLNITELDVERKLENLRKKSKYYNYPSFSAIVGSGSNGAIIHYRANKFSNKKLLKNDILLVDTGGQYNYGTTDVTRTISFINQSNYIKNIYTNVLKGHIAVTTSKINFNTTGAKLDRIARKYLKKFNLDYPHSTGHGVGYFLNVHEGPISISKSYNKPFSEGMILSNEPGYYKKNSFGIRIENLIYVKKKSKNLYFENLTLAPLDKELINFSMLTSKEKMYLKNYNLKIYNNLKNFLSEKEKKWLKNLF